MCKHVRARDNGRRMSSTASPTTEKYTPSGSLRGEMTPPPDKSVSHRAAMFAAMGEGTVRVEGYLDAGDTRSTLAAVQALGAEVRELAPPEDAPGGINLEIDGIGLRGPGENAAASGEPVAIDVGNAGTLLRLLPGWLAGQGQGHWVFDGDESIRRRPVDRVTKPLAQMGAKLAAREDRLVPLHVDGTTLKGIEYRLPVASAQVKSCVLLAGLLAEGETSVIEPNPSRDHTERMLRSFGVDVRTEKVGTDIAARGVLPAQKVTLTPPGSLNVGEIVVPGDLSSASFAIVGALIVPGSKVVIENVGLNPTRVGILGILSRMGAQLEIEEQRTVAGERIGRIVARHSNLNGTRVAEGEVPLAIDELPLVALAACFAEGDTVVTGAEELRHKESDRITSVVTGLRGLGAEIEEAPDGFRVTGTGGLKGGIINSGGDHRLAMLGAIAGLAAPQGVEIEDFGAAAVSYPGFATDVANLLAG